MGLTIGSAAGGMTLDAAPRLPMSSGPNTGAGQIPSALMVLLPDPDSAVVASQFVTSGGGAGGSWTVQIRRFHDGTDLGPVYTRIMPNSANVLWVPLDPAVFSVDGVYRVRVSDDGGNICDEWDFALFNHDASSAPADVTAINNKLRRIQGLLGWRRRVEFTQYVLGVCVSATVRLLDAAGAVIAQYRVKSTRAPDGTVVEQTSAALDNNNLG